MVSVARLDLLHLLLTAAYSDLPDERSRRDMAGVVGRTMEAMSE